MLFGAAETTYFKMPFAFLPRTEADVNCVNKDKRRKAAPTGTDSVEGNIVK